MKHFYEITFAQLARVSAYTRNAREELIQGGANVSSWHFPATAFRNIDVL